MTSKKPPNLFGLYASNKNSWSKLLQLCCKDNSIKPKDGCFYHDDESHWNFDIPLHWFLLGLVFGFPSEFSISVNVKFQTTEDSAISPNYHAGILFLNSANIINKTFLTGFPNFAFKKVFWSPILSETLNVIDRIAVEIVLPRNNILATDINKKHGE